MLVKNAFTFGMISSVWCIVKEVGKNNPLSPFAKVEEKGGLPRPL